jgi:hypothetical protein
MAAFRAPCIFIAIHFMTILVSAVLTPSRRLRLFLAAYALVHAAAALALLSASGPSALACLLAALLAAGAALRPGMQRRIDISGPGGLRLTVQQRLGETERVPAPMRLLPGSTVWPRGLFLLLRPEQGGALVALTIFPDSVAAPQFRAISVAIRAIAGRDNKFLEKHKIL